MEVLIVQEKLFGVSLTSDSCILRLIVPVQLPNVFLEINEGLRLSLYIVEFNCILNVDNIIKEVSSLHQLHLFDLVLCDLWLGVGQPAGPFFVIIIHAIVLHVLQNTALTHREHLAIHNANLPVCTLENLAWS